MVHGILKAITPDVVVKVLLDSQYPPDMLHVELLVLGQSNGLGNSDCVLDL